VDWKVCIGRRAFGRSVSTGMRRVLYVAKFAELCTSSRLENEQETTGGSGPAAQRYER
jgi:hypothetical protein